MPAFFKAFRRFTLAAALAVAAASWLGPGATVTAGFALASTPSPGDELPALRSRTSRTFLTADGTYRTVISAGPLNYRDASGQWQPIDNTLVAASSPGYAFQNRANDYRLLLPADLAQAPVRIERDGRWVSFALVGGAGSATTAGPRATFPAALPSVTLRYTATESAVKEELRLDDAAAASLYSFIVRTSSGLAPQLTPDGGIDFRTNSGEVAFAFAPPTAADANGAATDGVSFGLSSTAGGYLVTLSIDPSWLASSARSWPVLIDPTVVFQPATGDCTIDSSTPSTNYCSNLYLGVGYNGSSAKSRALLKFDTSTIPQLSTVLNADLAVYLDHSSTATVVPLTLHQLTRAWNSATWNNADTGVAWTSAGGDFASSSLWTTSSPGAANPTYHWFPRRLVQDWVRGTSANNGLLLRQQSESVNNILSFRSSDYSTCLATGNCGLPCDPPPAVCEPTRPSLTVDYVPLLGAQRYYTLDSQPLNDRMQASVNVVNGNLLLAASDLALSGVGHGLSLGRAYNSLAGNNAGVGIGYRWIRSSDPWLQIFGGSVAFHDQSGSVLPFDLNANGSFTSPPAADASLTKNGDGSYTLKTIAEERLNFSSAGYLTSDVDSNGNAISFVRDGSGRPTSITDTEGRVTSFGYATTTVTMTDPASRQQVTTINGSNDLASYRDALNGLTQFSYDSGHKLTQISDPLGKVTKITYDASGRVSTVVRVTNASAGTGPTTSFTYNADNTVVTDANSHGTTYYFDSVGRVTRVVDANGHSSSSDFTTAHGGSGCADNNACSTTDGLGKTTTFGYDTNNNLLWSQSPLQGTTNRPTFVYGNAGHPFFNTKYTDPQGGIWNYNFDESTGNLNGNLTSKTEGSAGQNPVRFTYNFGSTTHANGTIATATDAKGAVTTYSYTWDTTNPKLLKRLTANPPAPLPASTFNYDSLGRVSTDTDGNGNTRAYTYDALDRVTQVTYSNGGTSATIGYGYDLDGNLTSLVDNIGTTTNTYDALNRLTSEARPGGSSTTYTYDNGSNLTSLTDAGGMTSYVYDVDDLLIRITEPNGNQTAFGYDANHNRTSINYPGSVTGTIGYDDAQRISAVTWKKGATTLASFTYCYRTGTTAPTCSGGADSDLRRWVVSQIPNDTQSTTTTYGYDVLNRLTSASSSGGSTSTYTYEYDVNGNRKRQTVNGSSTYYLYNAPNELCWSGSTDPAVGGNTCSSLASGGRTYSYDANGNALTGSNDSFAYNVKNQTSSVTPTGGSAINMSYSGPGQARRTAAGATSYVNDVLGVAREASTYYVRDSGGAVLGERNPAGGSGSYYFLFDGVGSVTAVTDTTGVVKDTFKYDPYGGSTASTAPVANPWRFAGGYYDVATQLYKFGQRYYDTQIGRWSQLDAVDDPLDTHGWNRYIYAGDDPVNITDPGGNHYMPRREAVNWLKLCGEARHYHWQIRNQYTTICGSGHYRSFGHAPTWWETGKCLLLLGGVGLGTTEAAIGVRTLLKSKDVISLLAKEAKHALRHRRSIGKGGTTGLSLMFGEC